MQNTEHKERKKKTKTLRLFNPSLYGRNTSAKIQTIDLNEEYTRIDFKYNSSQEYINGGWIQMERNSFIRDTLSKRTYPLLFALNITIAPEKFHFRRKGRNDTLVKNISFCHISHKVKQTLKLRILLNVNLCENPRKPQSRACSTFRALLCLHQVPKINTDIWHCSI